MDSKERVVSFPRYADYHVVFKYTVEQGFGLQYVVPPETTSRTEKLGEKYSPEFVCTPFKTMLGGMIEALESGANTLITSYGLCRLGYFGELQEQIIKDLGYDFEIINFQEYNTGKKKDFIKAVKALNPDVNLVKLGAELINAKTMLEYIDDITAEYYKKAGFEITGGDAKKIYDTFIFDLSLCENREEIKSAYSKAKEGFRNLDIKIPQDPIKVGVVGEFYTAMDPFSNRNLEEKLTKMGVEVHRYLNITNRLFNYDKKALKKYIEEYATYEMGPTSTANIWATKKYCESGVDGIVHIKSANCTPEIDIVPVMRNVCADYKVPFITLTYDAQTSDVGLNTRIEAFFDMMSAKRKVIY